MGKANKSMRIAVLSDTHGLLRPEVAGIIQNSDAVIHGGDINSQKILDEIKNTAKPNAPLFAVRGNNDKEWAEHLPLTLEFELAGKRFFLVHSKFVKQVAVIRVTHPGVDADGIMNKIEVNSSITSRQR